MAKYYKPCPFCGSELVVILHQNLYAECLKCSCFGPCVHLNPFNKIQEEVVKSMIWDKWNERK